jgi:hypothetical protein
MFDMFSVSRSFVLLLFREAQAALLHLKPLEAARWLPCDGMLRGAMTLALVGTGAIPQAHQLAIQDLSQLTRRRP